MQISLSQVLLFMISPMLMVSTAAFLKLLQLNWR